SSNGPWVSDFIEMAKKTVVRSAWKWLPISVEIMQAVEERDDTIAHGIGENGMINVTPGFEGATDDDQRQIEPTDADWDEIAKQTAERDSAATDGGKLL